MRAIFAVDLVGKVAAAGLWALGCHGWAAACWLGPDAWVAWSVFAPNARGLGPVARRFATTRREAWLTIDDGPDILDTPRILALLAEHGARATFFVIGERAAAHPELVRAMVAGGHEVAHHTQTHPLAGFWGMPPGAVARELDAGTAALRAAAGVEPRRFRAPAGIKNFWLHAALARRGMVCVGWSARGREAGSRSVEAVVRRALRRLKPGAIVLLHEGRAVPAAMRVEAIRRVLERLRAEGYACVVPAAGDLC